MSNQSFRRRQEVIETDTETDLLDDLVGIFGINVVFNSLSSIFVEIFRDNLDQVGNFGLARYQ